MGRNELIEQNLRLVHACAHRFKGKGIDYDDLYSAGCVGLVKAVDRFDESLGYKLSTYAVPVILGEIKINGKKYTYSYVSCELTNKALYDFQFEWNCHKLNAIYRDAFPKYECHF